LSFLLSKKEKKPIKKEYYSFYCILSFLPHSNPHQ